MLLNCIGDFNDWDEVDCAVVTTQSSVADCLPTFKDLLLRGQSIVSTCEELSWPWLRHREAADMLHALALEHGGRLLGTGVNPGFLMDSFPLVVARAARRVDTVKVYRIQDATSRRIPFQKKIGAGLDRMTFQSRIDDGSLRHVGLGESIHFLGHYLGLRFDRWTESIEPVEGDAGLMSGVRQVGRAFSGGECVIELFFQAAVGQENPHDRVVLEGDPPLDVTWKGGVHGDIATSATVINVIKPLLAAPPGLHTMASIPLSGRPRKS